MTEKTKITVITICYNSENTIESTIKSVIFQNYENMEYIIIDGGSTDKTIDIVKTYVGQYHYIKYTSEPDDGIADAFNKGISKATGVLIGLINSDDLLHSGALELVDKVYRRTGADVIYGDSVIIDEIGFKRLKKASPLSIMKYEMPFIHQSCFITQHAYKTKKYSNEYKLCMDFDMVAFLYKEKYAFAYTGEVISIFRYGGASCAWPLKTIDENVKIAKKYGLNNKEALYYKVKAVTRNIVKMILRKIGIWKYLCFCLKKNEIIDCINKDI